MAKNIGWKVSLVITLKDFDIRYKSILEEDSNRKRCSITGCSNPVDRTLIGEDTTCAYHRLLFDWWIYEVLTHKQFIHYLKSQKGRRRAFTNWRNKLSNKEQDGIVLKMAQDAINWIC